MAPTHADIGAAGARVALALLCMLLAPLLSVSSLAVSPLAHTTASTLLTTSSADDQYFDFLVATATLRSTTAVTSSINKNYNFNPLRPLQQWTNVIDPIASKFTIKNGKDLKIEKLNEQNGPIPIKRLDTSIDRNHLTIRAKHIQSHDTASIVSAHKNYKDDQLTSVTRTSRLSDNSEVYSVRKIRNNSSDRGKLTLTNSTTRAVDRSSVLSKYSDLGTNRNRSNNKTLPESVPTERNVVQIERKIVTTIASIPTKTSNKATSSDRNVTGEWSNQFNGNCYAHIILYLNLS